MERGNFVNPELTGQGQNAYSRGGGNIMPEVGGEVQHGASRGPQIPRTPEQVQAGVADWERYMSSQGETMTPEMRQTLGLFSRMGMVPPDNPRGEQRVFP